MSPFDAALSDPPAVRVLILGGSSEARALAAALAARPDVSAILSLAGRTAEPTPQPIATRVGGFGGVNGLATYIEAEQIGMLIDATHPFATQMQSHARQAARITGCRFVRVGRLPWEPQPGDNWLEVDTMADAVVALGDRPRRPFLTVGRQQIEAFAAAPWHHYLVRTIDPVASGHGLSDARFITARGPFAEAAEERLMQEYSIDVLVTKNSGGAAARGKLDAARRLGVPVILVRPPPVIGGFLGVDEAIVSIPAHWATVPRGV